MVKSSRNQKPIHKTSSKSLQASILALRKKEKLSRKTPHPNEKSTKTLSATNVSNRSKLKPSDSLKDSSDSIRLQDASLIDDNCSHSEKPPRPSVDFNSRNPTNEIISSQYDSGEDIDNLHSSTSRPATSPAGFNEGKQISKKSPKQRDCKKKSSLTTHALKNKPISPQSHPSNPSSTSQNPPDQAKLWQECSKKIPQSYKHTSALISEFHTLQKALARTTDPIQRKQILKQQAQLGGLKTYQAASSYAGSKEKGGETGKWCAKALEEHLGRGKKNITLLDVGAISGTSYEKFSWIKTTSIDLNPQDPTKVLKYDFMEFPIPEEKFDVIGLSLVLNFVGDLRQRSEMIKHAHQYLKPFGFLYIVLPLACVENSRYLDSNRFKSILNSLGFESLKQHNSSKLTFWLTQRSGTNGMGVIHKNIKWPKEEIRKGINRNNFCIKV